MKKNLAIMLTLLLMIICIIYASAGNAVGSPESKKFECEEYEYIILDDGTAEIVWYSGNEEKLIIPSNLNDTRVTSIGACAFNGCESLTSVTIPDSVTSIGYSAFSGCFSLTSITIPNSVISIGNYVFEWCESLTSVMIPNSVIDIGDNPFSGCEKLNEIIVSEDHPCLTMIDGILYSKSDKRLLCCPCAIKTESLMIAQGTQIIGSFAFKDCYSLCSVTIPDSVIRIEVGAFWGCDSLLSITIPDGVTSIGHSVFSDCESLTSVTIPNSVKDIGDNPFSSCKKLTEIIISEDHPYLAVMDGVLFSKPEKRLVCYPCGLKADCYKIPEEVQIVGDSAFADCSSLVSIIIPDSVNSIEAWAFSCCHALTSITIPESVTSIEHDTFSYCSSLNSVMIPDGVTSIGSDAFLCCDSLTSITIPDGVTSIEFGAFGDCLNLNSITIPDSVTYIATDAFMVFRNGWVPNPSLVATVSRDSYAKQYCEENEIRYTYPDALDWLNN